MFHTLPFICASFSLLLKYRWALNAFQPLDLADWTLWRPPARPSCTGHSRGKTWRSGRCMWSATWMLHPGNDSGSWTEWTESLAARWTCGGPPHLLLYRPPYSSLLLSPYVRFSFGTYSWGEYEQPSGCQTLGHTLKNGSGGSGLLQRHQLHMGKSTCSQSGGRLSGVYHRLNASVALFSLRLKEHLAALESAHDRFYPQSSVTSVRPACRQSSLLCFLMFWKLLLNFSLQ